ncbi:GntR family transcriptional regulator (plasmid) [Arthrobacter agilis]|uniref:GntR family transcriptional regulator n=1 Tax=Arthrobacter agilis TaxID=37921 RepID=UPI002366B1E6|nr:GntR family transcriptional regulator [Arthrobacter agilis]WDF35296.1 GntR family transcriptional regulator [Arthrobacter agilis]
MNNPQLLASPVGTDVTTLLRRQILSGSLSADERIFPKDLVARYGVSHIPIREAMRTLAAEGLVVYEPRKGAKVAGLSQSQLEEVYRLRRAIEPPIVKHSAEARSAAQLDTARRAYALMVETGTSDLEGFLSCHSSFHWALLNVDLGPLTKSLLQQTSNISERYVRLGFAAFQIDARAHEDHAALLSAFEDGDGERTALELNRHLHLIESTLIAHLESDFPSGS